MMTKQLFGIAFLSLTFTAPLRAAEGRVIVWDGPGGDVAASPDYEVTVRRSALTWPVFTHQSFNRPYDKSIDAEGQYLKMSFLALHSVEPPAPEKSRDTYAHSWAQFDFDGGPVEVEVRIRRAFTGLTLPLESCAVLPASLGVTAKVVGRDTIRFTMPCPAKIAIVPNHTRAFAELAKSETKQALEGYRNPLFLFARAPEQNIPDKNAPGTLVVRPGHAFTPAELAQAKAVWFEPGVHDYSRFAGDENHYIVLRTGQSVYVAGGAYIYGNFRSDVKHPISDMPTLRGRGTLSGLRQRWNDRPNAMTVVAHVHLDGVQIADTHNHLSHSTAPMRDIAVVGAWHGNTDGPTIEAHEPDPYTGWHIEDCFVMAADTNLKIRGSGRVHGYTLWQLNNAEPIWLRDPDQSVIEDVQVLAFNNWPTPGSRATRQVVNFHVDPAGAKNTLVKNLTIEAPFVPLLFFMPVERVDDGTVFENVVFENVTVTTPSIFAKSPFGAAKPNGTRAGRIVFRNLVINGIRVTNANCRDYFDLLDGVTAGKELVFE
jgi:hypothetical protein